MKEAVKLVPVLVLLTASVSVLAQGRAAAMEAKPSPPKTMTIDSKTYDEMRATAKDLDTHLQELKNCLNHERSAASVSGRSAPAERAASDAQVQALERSIQQLRQQVENGPHYLDQNNPLRP